MFPFGACILVVGYVALYAWIVVVSYLWFGEGLALIQELRESGALQPHTLASDWLEPRNLYGWTPAACVALIAIGHWLVARTGRSLRLDPIAEGYARLLRWLLVFAVGVLIVPVSLQIFSRYTELIPSYIWTEEMARFFLVWTVMIGAIL